MANVAVDKSNCRFKGESRKHRYSAYALKASVSAAIRRWLPRRAVLPRDAAQ